MTLKEIIKEIEDMTNIDEAREMCNDLMNDDQTYFTWEVDGVSFFEVDNAFESVLEHTQYQEKGGKKLTDFGTAVIDTHLMVLLEYR